VRYQLHYNRKNKLLLTLRSLVNSDDPEYDHRAADRALLDYINDPEVTKAFENIKK